MFGLRRSPEGSAQVQELARLMQIEEYSTLRAEILASYGYAQSIVKWTLATFAAIAAAGLIAINDSTGVSSNPILINVVLVLFGFGLPVIVWLNAWTWLGELYRAERAGSYLRALEGELSRVPGIRRSSGVDPIRWERFIWSNRRSKTLWGKQTITYLGTAGTFFGCAAGSVLILVVTLSQVMTDRRISPPELAWLWVAGSVLANIVAMYFCFRIYQRLSKLGDAVAPLSPVF